MTFFLMLLYQASGEFEFVYEPEPDYSIWLLVILAVILFPVFFWWIRRRFTAGAGKPTTD